MIKSITFAFIMLIGVFHVVFIVIGKLILFIVL